MVSPPYVGRFAPSPSGPLHEGSLVAAMASLLDARAHGGSWLVRMEDVDRPRTQPGADRVILAQLQALGMVADAPPIYQSDRDAAYAAAFGRLHRQGLIYGCACTRREIAVAARAALARATQGEAVVSEAAVGEEQPYPGTCRDGVPAGREPRAWRVRMPGGVCRFHDRWCGDQAQDVAQAVGDVALRRADGLWAYQLAVVVDDAAQGVTDVVRGADLLSSTARQIRLADMLGLAVPTYMHVPLVMDEQTGLKLSKQNHAAPLAIDRPLDTLKHAYARLGFGASAAPSMAAFWGEAIAGWGARFGRVGRGQAGFTKGR